MAWVLVCARVRVRVQVQVQARDREVRFCDMTEQIQAGEGRLLSNLKYGKQAEVFVVGFGCDAGIFAGGVDVVVFGALHRVCVVTGACSFRRP